MLQLWHHRELIERNKIQVIVITFDHHELADQYAKQAEWTWPLLLDRDRQTYETYTKGPASLAALAGPTSIFKYLKLIWGGQKLQKGGEDYFQLGGDVIIDPENMIRLHHLSRNPHDRPKVRDVLHQLFPES